MNPDIPELLVSNAHPFNNSQMHFCLMWTRPPPPDRSQCPGLLGGHVFADTDTVTGQQAPFLSMTLFASGGHGGCWDLSLLQRLLPPGAPLPFLLQGWTEHTRSITSTSLWKESGMWLFLGLKKHLLSLVRTRYLHGSYQHYLFATLKKTP